MEVIIIKDLCSTHKIQLTAVVSINVLHVFYIFIHYCMNKIQENTIYSRGKTSVNHKINIVADASAGTMAHNNDSNNSNNKICAKGSV